MTIEKQTSYSCSFTNEERNALKEAMNIIGDLLKNMEELKCTYADCTEYLDCPEGISFEGLKSVKLALYELQNLNEIHG